MYFAGSCCIKRYRAGAITARCHSSGAGTRERTRPTAPSRSDQAPIFLHRRSAAIFSSFPLPPSLLSPPLDVLNLYRSSLSRLSFSPTRSSLFYAVVRPCSPAVEFVEFPFLSCVSLLFSLISKVGKRIESSPPFSTASNPLLSPFHPTSLLTDLGIQKY